MRLAKWVAAVAVGSLVAVQSAGRADAALTVRVQSVTIAPGATGYLDAFVTVIGTEAESVNTFVVGLNSPLTITGGFSDDGSYRTDAAAVGGTRPMLLGAAPYDGTGTSRADGTAVGFQSFLPTATPTAGVPLAGANGLGLARVAFTVPAGTPAGTTYRIDVDPTLTSFATPGADSAEIPFGTASGTVTVGVPEPGGPAAAAAVAAAGLALRRRGRCRRRAGC